MVDMDKLDITEYVDKNKCVGCGKVDKNSYRYRSVGILCGICMSI